MDRIILKVVSYTDKAADIQLVRVRVFQVEQGVNPALEFDGRDETAEHLLAYLDDRPVGTARIRYLDSQTAKVERLAVLPDARRKGIGKQLMEKALEVAAQNEMEEVVIHAQDYVKNLYQTLGFVQEGDGFEEAGIPHIKMRKRMANSR
ncbi:MULTISPECIES: GNAT family N-acetyltransferase [unclassified Coleofasciculus]|uniref:GNAT family N-acetyltransferase n=1 Tax=unclassified Coleofasciculus TaxID=2692782 RepID=UPI00187FFC8A|nr:MULTISPECIES: GNAT family N-acetyltransferase [unclassified Coleofasciculus]MBE9128448.1 GNAT family N-acetyltransferase [Coleofasciculus sp. LEGE 07081]MBE9148235.1 GNAT family N-acetyltransferase [Coleofasciculus sp. LEGE 07092]